MPRTISALMAVCVIAVAAPAPGDLLRPGAVKRNSILRTLLSALAVGLLVLAAAPQIALACHQGVPHGNEISCDGAGAPGSGVFQFVGFTDDGAKATSG